MATEEAENPDLRDRAYIYWRMLSTSPEKAAEVVLGDKPTISHESYNTYEGEFVEELLAQISSICSIYHKTPEEMRKLYKISTESGMISRVSRNKLEAGANMLTDNIKNENTKVVEEKKEKKEKKAKKEKSVRMDDSSSDDDKKKKKKELLDGSDEDEDKQPKPENNNLIEDLLGLGDPQP
jgi:AP-1 complex subunit beta-1